MPSIERLIVTTSNDLHYQTFNCQVCVAQLVCWQRSCERAQLLRTDYGAFNKLARCVPFLFVNRRSESRVFIHVPGVRLNCGCGFQQLFLSIPKLRNFCVSPLLGGR